MNEIKAPRTENDSISSPFSRLPDEVVFHILTKSTDLKDLCFCELVSTRFARIVHQVDTITLDLQLGIRKSLLTLIKKFKSVKTLCIILSPSCRVPKVDDCFRFKWKIKFGEKDVSLLLDKGKSVYVDGDGDQLRGKNAEIGLECYHDVMARFNMLVQWAIHLPYLEMFYLRDSDERGMVSISGGKLSEMKNWVNSCESSGVVDWKTRMVSVCPLQWKHCYVPVSELSVSGYMMKGVTLLLCDTKIGRVKYNNDLNLGADAVEFDDKDEAAYLESVMDIFKKQWDDQRNGR